MVISVRLSTDRWRRGGRRGVHVHKPLVRITFAGAGEIRRTAGQGAIPEHRPKGEPVRTSRAVIAGFVLATGMWAVPAAADAVSTSREGVTAKEYSDWAGVTVYDTERDGNGVYSQFRRHSGSFNEIRNDRGAGTSESSGVDRNNKVTKFNACNDLRYRPDPCTNYVEP
jgi:hypothetical protein